ncbi:hypothetical protein WY02_14365 [Pseudonocardia sp. AL041005-10]|nr:hypothetical protein WY02_14365 [Pseudonocardia sp. AL041005-10]
MPGAPSTVGTPVGTVRVTEPALSNTNVIGSCAPEGTGRVRPSATSCTRLALVGVSCRLPGETSAMSCGMVASPWICTDAAAGEVTDTRRSATEPVLTRVATSGAAPPWR